MKIKDLAVGETVAISLLVKEAKILYTKAQKPYLFMELFDGSESIKCQDWDYGDNAPPERNTVLNINGQVSEYMGNKQIKITAMQPSDLGVESFAPQGDFSITEYVEKAKQLIDGIGNIALQELVRNVFRDSSALWKTIPAARGVHHAFVAGNLKHSVDVTLKAKALAELIPGCNVDLVVGGALLHDLGKLWTYELNGAIIDMTDEGQMLEHIVMGIKKTEEYRTPENSDVLDLVQHIQSSHHGLLEYGSPTTPRFIEALVVNYADGIDAKSQTVLEAEAKCPPGAKQTDKIWILDNRPMYTSSYINSIMNK